MYSSLLFLFTSALVASVLADEKRDVFEKCANDNGVPQKIMEDAFNIVSVHGLKDYKCFAKCLYESYDLILPDGTANAARLKAVIIEDFKQPELDALLSEVIDGCVAKQGSAENQCDYFFSLMNCLYEQVASGSLSELNLKNRR